MSAAFVVLLVGLGLAGLFPATAVIRRSPATVFLAPLIGAGMAAIASECELAIGGTLLAWYLVIAICTNIAVAAYRHTMPVHKTNPPPSWKSSFSTTVLLLAAMIFPLTALRAGMIGYDGNIIWLAHALMVSGGHHEMLSALQNPVYAQASYPPLVPASGALSFALFGYGNLRAVAQLTALLNACGVGVAAAGVAAVASSGRTLSRVAAVAAAAAICMVAFAVTGPMNAVGGYADLLWASCAVGAVIWGLVLPPSAQALGVAWVCAAVASLTKQEGLVTALVVLILITLRYRPLTPGRIGPGRSLNERCASASRSSQAHAWLERAAFVAVPALPALAWVALASLFGLHSSPALAPANQTVATRAAAAVHGMAGHLSVFPAALAVLGLGCYLLRLERTRLHLGNPLWLWTAGALSTTAIFATYVFGAFEIHWWLRTSVDRTTIFAQLLLYADLACWLVIASTGIVPSGREQPDKSHGLGPPRRAGPMTPGASVDPLIHRD